MPIYAYKCAACGHARDILQKMSDQRLTVCPACGAAAFSKQVTAAGFQLKGSGWYATDFKGGSNGAGAAKEGERNGAEKSGDAAAPADSAAKPADAAKPAEASQAARPAEAAKAARPAESGSASGKSSSGPAASAGGCGRSCACH